MKNFLVPLTFIVFCLLIGCSQPSELPIEVPQNAPYSDTVIAITEPVSEAYSSESESYAEGEVAQVNVPTPTLVPATVSLAPSVTAVPTDVVLAATPLPTATEPVVSPTPTRKPTQVYLTATQVASTATSAPPTATFVPPTATLVPTSTPNWSATATAEWIPSPTPEWVATATPLPTATPWPTATPVWEATATPWPTATSEASATVDFWMTPLNPQPGERVHVGWDVGDVAGVTVRVGDSDWSTTAAVEQWFWDLPLKGEIWFDLPPRDCFEELPVRLYSTDGDENLLAEIGKIIVAYETQPWVFEPAPTDFCPFNASWSKLSEQRFEGGWMIWAESEDRIYVLEDNGGRTVTLFWDNFDVNFHPIEDASIVPPEGLLQPRFGFGKIWRENPWVQERLGWAVSAESNQTNFIQIYNENFGESMGIYVSGADGFVWEIEGSEFGQFNWRKLTIPNAQ